MKVVWASRLCSQHTRRERYLRHPRRANPEGQSSSNLEIVSNLRACCTFGMRMPTHAVFASAATGPYNNKKRLGRLGAAILGFWITS